MEKSDLVRLHHEFVLYILVFASPPPQGHSSRVDACCHSGGNPSAQHVSSLLHFFGELGVWRSLKLNVACVSGMAMRKAAFLHSRGRSQWSYSELRGFLYSASQLWVGVKGGLFQNAQMQRKVKGWSLIHESITPCFATSNNRALYLVGEYKTEELERH